MLTDGCYYCDLAGTNEWTSHASISLLRINGRHCGARGPWTSAKEMIPRRTFSSKNSGSGKILNRTHPRDLCNSTHYANKKVLGFVLSTHVSRYILCTRIIIQSYPHHSCSHLLQTHRSSRLVRNRPQLGITLVFRVNSQECPPSELHFPAI